MPPITAPQAILGGSSNCAAFTSPSSISNVSITAGSSTVPILRGSPQRLTNFMEAFQVGYVRAVAAAAGCVVNPAPEIDEGIDLTLTHVATSHLIDKARLEIQLKAVSVPLAPGASNVSVRMKRVRYDELRIADPSVSKILVVMSVPPSQNDWIHASQNRLKVHHAAYWVNLDGAPATAAAQPTVSAPVSQIFDDIALCAMMGRIGQGLKP